MTITPTKRAYSIFESERALLLDIFHMADIGYWAELDDTETALVEHDGGTTHPCDLDTVKRGVQRVLGGQFDAYNMGYTEPLRDRLAAFYGTLGADGDIDAADADAIIQAGVFTDEAGPVFG